MNARSLIILVGLLAVGALGMWLLFDIKERNHVELTIEETLGAVFMQEVGPRGSVGWAILASANPNAKPQLYQLLHNKDIAEYHANILLMIGYIGDENDVLLLEEWHSQSFEGELSFDEFQAIRTVFSSLSTMSRRGIQPAQTLLGQMSTPDYWEQRRDNFTLPPEAAPGPLAGQPVDVFVFPALGAYAASGADDWKKKIQMYLDQIDDADVKAFMSSQLEEGRMEKYRKSVVEASYPPIPEETRRALGQMFNGDMENPGRS